jgi:hypothetical protein
MRFVLRIAVLIVRGWTELYTFRMSAAEQTLRRDAIDSDLWECVHDPDRRSHLGTALHVLGRAIRGVPDDLRWRVEQTRLSYLPRTALLTALLLIAGTLLDLHISMPPAPPAPVPLIVMLETPPPPPPPPEKQGGRHDRDYWKSQP